MQPHFQPVNLLTDLKIGWVKGQIKDLHSFQLY
jgi:hypothetical protein